jgi:hypothetical protein
VAGVDPTLGVLGLCWRTIDLFLLGSDQVTRSHEVLRHHATQLGHRSALYMVALFDVMLLVRAGRLDEAERPVLPSLAVMCLGSAERWLGLAAQIGGDLDLAGHHLDRAVQANLALGHHPLVAMTRAELVGVLLARRASPGDAERAAELLDLAVAAAETMGMSRRAAHWRELLAGLPAPAAGGGGG